MCLLLGCQHFHLTVRVGRDADEHRVERFLIQHFLEIGVCHCSELLRRLFGARAVNVADCGDLCPRYPTDALHVSARVATRADKSDLDGF